MSQVSQENAPTLREYVRTVWIRKWVVLAVAAIFVSAALAWELRKPDTYEATAQLTYSPPADPTNPSSGGYIDATTLTMLLQSVVNIINSPAVRAQAEADLEPDELPEEYTVTATVVTPAGTTSSAIADTVAVTARAGAPEAVADVANAYALAIIELRKSGQQEALREAQRMIEEQLEVFQSDESKLSSDYASLTLRLRNLQFAEAVANGDFVVFSPATPPSSPVSPRPVEYALLGLSAGLFFGVVAAFVLGQFDNRVRTHEEAAALLQMPLWGRVRVMSAKALDRQPLYVLSEPNSSAAEAIRKLRGSLEFSNVDGEFKSFFVTSALQGEGKTVMTCNMAIALAEAGYRVVLVDADLRRPQVHRYFELPNAVGVASVLTGKTPLPDALHFRPVGRRVVTLGDAAPVGAVASERNGLSVLTSGDVPPNPGEVIASKSFAKLVGRLESDFDIVVVDAPALLAVSDTAAMARCVGGLVFLVRLDRARRPLLLESSAQISQMPCRKLGLIVIGDGASGRYSQDLYYHSDGLSAVSNVPREAVAPGRAAPRGASQVSIGLSGSENEQTTS